MITIIRPDNRDKWLELRKQGIGSSEVGVILGVNPYETTYQLWRRKRGMDPAKEENFLMKAGHYIEDAVAKFWEDATQRKVIKSSAGDWLCVNDEKPFIRVSPDRTFWVDSNGKHNRNNKGILECKTTQKEITEDNIPRSWFCQIQYQLGGADVKFGSLAWLIKARQFGYMDVEFNKDFFDWMIGKVEDFWTNNVVKGVEPPAMDPSDILIKYPNHIDGKINEASEAVALACEKYKELNEQIAKLEDARKEYEKTIKMAFDDAEALSYGGLNIASWKKSKDSERFDTARFKTEHPELVAEYLKVQKGSRRFIVR